MSLVGVSSGGSGIASFLPRERLALGGTSEECSLSGGGKARDKLLKKKVFSKDY